MSLLKRFLYLFFVLSSLPFFAQGPWPASPWTSSTDLTFLEPVDWSSNLSGVYWNHSTRSLWACSNNGKFWKIKEDGSGSFMVDNTGGYAEWSSPGDFEGITQADHDTSIFIMDENALTIREFGVSIHGTTNLLVNWNIGADVAPMSGTSGPDGIGFVPDAWLSCHGFVDKDGNLYTSQNGMGGLFFITNQNGGHIYVFDLKRDGTYIFVGKYETYSTRCSDVAFDLSLGKLFILHQGVGPNNYYISVTDLTSTPVSPGLRKFNTQFAFDGPKTTGQLEGIALPPDSAGLKWCFMADDANDNGSLRWFTDFNPFFGPFFTADKTSACIGELISFIDTTSGLCGATTYTWDFGSGSSPATATGKGPHSVSYNTPGSKNIKLKIKGNVNDSIVKASYVTINALPGISFSGNTAVCIGNSTTLSVSGAISYLWSSGVTTAVVMLSPTSTSTFTITGTDGNGCSNSTTVSVTVNNLPVITSNGNTTICWGDNTILTASGADYYTWSSGETTAIVVLSPTSTTSYTITGTDGNGCLNTTHVSLTVNDLPITAAAGNTTICKGDNTTLTASGAVYYTWSLGETTAVLILAPTSTTTYTVTGTDGNNCSNTATATIIVTPVPDIYISGTSSICEGDSVTLTASGAAYYSWNNSATVNVIEVNPTSSTTYTLTGTTNGCNNTIAFTITVNNTPDANAGNDTSICYGASVTLKASGGAAYSWISGPATQSYSITPGATAPYIVSVFNGLCSDNDTVTVTVMPLPTATACCSTTITAGDAIALSGNGSGSYEWLPAAGLDCNTCQFPIAQPDTTTNYCLQLTGANGCKDTAVCINITVIPKCDNLYIPNAFSPNGDSINDVFFIPDPCIKTMTLYIYNRWGEEVFITENTTAKWDGMYQNMPLNPDVYFYKIIGITMDDSDINRIGTIALVK